MIKHLNVCQQLQFWSEIIIWRKIEIYVKIEILVESRNFQKKKLPTKSRCKFIVFLYFVIITIFDQIPTFLDRIGFRNLLRFKNKHILEHTF